MEISVKRLWSGPETPTQEGATTGALYVDGHQMCFTLEDRVREISGLDVKEWKVDWKTAIPRGRYKVVIDFSNRHQKMMPHILDVPGFTGIRFDVANVAGELKGCIAVGHVRNNDYLITHSEEAWDELFGTILAAIANNEEVWCTVQ